MIETLPLDHPCKGCDRVAIDHAIACPALGIIAAGRHKAILRSDTQTAFDKLHGWAHVPNKRESIKLRSTYWRTEGSTQVGRKRAMGSKATAEGSITLVKLRKRRESESDSKATRGTDSMGTPAMLTSARSSRTSADAKGRLSQTQTESTSRRGDAKGRGSDPIS